MIHASVFLRRAFLLDTVASGMMALLLTSAPASWRRCSTCQKNCCARPAWS